MTDLELRILRAVPGSGDSKGSSLSSITERLEADMFSVRSAKGRLIEKGLVEVVITPGALPFIRRTPRGDKLEAKPKEGL